MPRRKRLFVRILAYATAGVVLTYAVAALCAILAPIPSMSYSGRVALARWRPNTIRPYLWLRTWNAPHGAHFQIYTANARTGMLSMFFDLEKVRFDADGSGDPALIPTDAASLDRLETAATVPLISGPEALPPWSRLRPNWPESLEQIEATLEQGDSWNEAVMGWPLPCLRGEYVNVHSRGTQQRDVRGAIMIVRSPAYTGRWASFRMAVALPFIPVWPRFVANVAFYAVLCFAAVAGRRALRAWLRRRRGRCPRCGYDLRGTPRRCPECGTEVCKARGEAAHGKCAQRATSPGGGRPTGPRCAYGVACAPSRRPCASYRLRSMSLIAFVMWTICPV